MTNQGRRYTRALSFCFALAGIAVWQCAGPAAAQMACPNWSAKFDLIDDPALLQRLRANQSGGWASLIQQGVAQGSSVQQQIATAEQTIQELQARLATDEATWSKVASSPGPMPSASAQLCAQFKNPNAATVVDCDAHLTQNTILATEGTLEILRCYAGLGSAAGALANDGAPGAFLAPESATVTSPRYDVGLAQQNTVRRQNMVETAVGRWNPPQQLTASSSTIGIGNLSDPFAPSANSTAISPSDGNLPAIPTPMGVADVAESGDANYPEVAASPTVADSDSDLSATDWREKAVEIEQEGIAQTSDVGDTVVDFFDNLKNWADISSSNPSEQINGTIGVLGSLNSQFNTNALSSAVTAQSLGVIDTEAQKMMGTLNVVGGTIADGLPSAANQNVNEAIQNLTTLNTPGILLESPSQAIQTGWQDIQQTFSQWFSPKCSPFGDPPCK